jgi:glycosyltransferase involved in cell wall biosynthesis
VDLSRAPVLLAGAPTPALVVFWAGDRPVGQTYVALPPAGILTTELAAGAVDPAAWREPPPRATAARPRTSVVICTRDRPDLLARCLQSLATQSVRPDEVVVVDNAPSDDLTRQVAAAASARYVREDRAGLDVARNAGWRAAHGQIIAYTDDDVVLHPRWLERLVAAFDEEIAGVTGLVLPAELATPAQRLFERHWGFGRGFCRIDFGQEFYAQDRTDACPVWKIGAGASMAFRRDVFEQVGGFDERLDAGAAGCSGDSELWHRILGRGLTLRYEPSAVAFHEHRRDLGALARQIRAYARGHVAALLIQHARTGHRGNLKRALLRLPAYYARRAWQRGCGRRADADQFLRQEIGGWMSGIAYYLRARTRPAVQRGEAAT